jgi:CubicO group peptidase (beta-lactamase class C family)
MTVSLLAATARRLEVEVAATQASGRLPAVAAGVLRDGVLVWSTGRGRTVRRDGAERPDADTQFKIGSVTKTFTAALVLLAAERGELSLADQVGRFLPHGPFADATVRSLLGHTSGISAEPLGSWWERSPGVDLATLAAAHEGSERVLEPGARHHYSNLGFGVLGEVVASLDGTTWIEVLQARILDPLGLRRTTYQMQAPYAEGFAVHHLTGELTVEPLPDTGAMAPAGQLWSTVGDLTTWLVALVDPERSVLSAASLEAMRTPQGGTPEDLVGATYGLGVSLTPHGGRVLVGHGGSMPGFCCGVQVDPASGVGAVVLTNGAYGLDDLTSRLVHTVLDQEPPLAPEWLPTGSVVDDVRAVTGLWYWGQAPSLLRVHGDGIELCPVGGPGRTLVFRRVGTDTFVGTSGYHTGETLRVVRDADGAVSHLEVATFVYTRTPYDPAAPIPGGPPEPPWGRPPAS